SVTRCRGIHARRDRRHAGYTGRDGAQRPASCPRLIAEAVERIQEPPMTYEPRIGPDGRDDDLTRALRQIYAAPAEEGYWSTLAQRIMSRIAGAVEAESWWSPLADWARVGIVAAAAAVIVAGLALTKSREAEARLGTTRSSKRPVRRLCRSPPSTARARSAMPPCGT